jgi:hypothetical protein
VPSFIKSIQKVDTMKKVLISAPISGLKQYSINEWLYWIANQNYKIYEVCLCVNGKESKELAEKLKTVEIRDVHNQTKKLIVLELEGSEKLTTIQKITYSREKIRRYAVLNQYDSIFFLDTDTIPAYKDSITRLISHNKESISGLYFYKHSKVPVIIDLNTRTNVSMELINHLVADEEITEVWGYGYGCLLLSGSALNVAFDYKIFEQERTDDFGHCHALEQKGIKRYFDPLIICKHFDTQEATKFMNGIMGIKTERIK